jgi:uncharacterized protein YxjI
MSQPETVSAGYVLEVRQRFTVMVNRYEVVGLAQSGPPTPLAFAEQKRMSLKEKVTFWAGTDKGTVVFTIGARNIIELAGTYDVHASGGELLATIRKNARTSLLRSTYETTLPDGRVVIGQERGQTKAILRRVVSFGTDFPWPFPIHFDFADRDGRPVLAIERQMRVRDVYTVSVSDSGLDWRVAAALAVTVDAFMNR